MELEREKIVFALGTVCLFLNIGTRPIFLKWKFLTNYTLTVKSQQAWIGTWQVNFITEKTEKRQRLLWGSSPQPCAPQVRLGAPLGKQLFLALFFWLSSTRVRRLIGRITQRPVVVASLWLGAIETSILCLNSSKQHRPQCYAYRTTLTVGTVGL